MTHDLDAILKAHGPGLHDHAVLGPMAEMKGSTILGIAGQVRALKAQGLEICDLTVGDFSPLHFRIPAELTQEITRALEAGHTNYPPADGVPELKAAIVRLYERQLGLKFSPDWVCVASGARPPIYAAWRLFTLPGDRTLSSLPMWNTGYYAQLCQTRHEYLSTRAEDGFFPTVEQVRRALPGARLLALNSPLNPTGTAIERDVIEGIARALVDENRRRLPLGQPPCILLYDQVYWLLPSPGVQHHSPVSLVPECAPWVVHVDAISKCFAATGLRVGWAVLPPALQGPMKSLIGHIGAWAPRPEQLATARLLDRPDRTEAALNALRGQLDERLSLAYTAISAMEAQGLPVHAVKPQGALYLSLRVDLVGRGFHSNEAIRAWLLEEAGFAVVPFQAFDLDEDSGWFRMSVGAVGVAELDVALQRLRAVVAARFGDVASGQAGRSG